MASSSSGAWWDGGAGVSSTRASRSDWSGSGRTLTAADQPRASAATCAWWRAAPQLITRLRPSGSPATSWRERSAYSSRVSAPPRQRHGWVLCTLGARIATSTIRRRGTWRGIDEAVAVTGPPSEVRLRQDDFHDAGRCGSRLKPDPPTGSAAGTKVLAARAHPPGFVAAWADYGGGRDRPF